MEYGVVREAWYALEGAFWLAVAIVVVCFIVAPACIAWVAYNAAGLIAADIWDALRGKRGS